MKYRFFSILALVLLVAIAYYRYSLPIRVSDGTFRDYYNVGALENDLSKRYGFECNRILTGEYRTIEARSALHARVKVVWHRIMRTPTKTFEVRVFQHGPARFSVTAEFVESNIVAIYVKAESESLLAAEFWSRSFRKEFPNAPIDSAIRPMKDEELGKPGSTSEGKAGVQTIPLP